MTGAFTVGILGPASAADDDAPLPDAAVAAWVAVRPWIDRLEVPASGSPEAAVPLEGCSGVAVTLLAAGRPVAAGEDATPDGEMLRRAAGRALRRLDEHPSSEWPPPLRDSFRRQLTLEVELLGTPRPLLGRTFAEAGERIEPGIDGLAFRRGDRWAHAFPSRLVAIGTAGDPGRTLRQLAKDLELPPLELAELLAQSEIGAYRVPAFSLGQTEPGMPPRELLRGRVPVPLAAIDSDAAAEMARLLLSHLEARFVPSADPAAAEASEAAAALAGLGLRGDYDPIADRHLPLAASPLEQALAAWSAARLGETLPQLRAAADRLARRVLGELAIENPVEEPPLGTVDAAAAIVLASLATDVDGDDAAGDLIARATTMLRDALLAEADAREPLSPGRAILLAATSLEAFHRGRPAIVDAAVAAAVARSAWDRASPPQRIGLLAWFALAARATEPPVIAPEELAALREFLRTRQIGSSASADLQGGFDLEDGLRPAADARSIVPAVGLSVLLGDARLTGVSELATAIASHRRMLRFLRQMQVTPPADARYRRPESARGGIRAALWESREPLLASSMAVWLLAESFAAGVPSPPLTLP